MKQENIGQVPIQMAAAWWEPITSVLWNNFFTYAAEAKKVFKNRITVTINSTPHEATPEITYQCLKKQVSAILN